MLATETVSYPNFPGHLSSEDVDSLYVQHNTEKTKLNFTQEFWNSECTRLAATINSLLEENVELKYVVDQLKAQLYVLHSLPY